ncbi:DUF2271 domain-containing protein [Elizabethkingia sp. JS20170427COW]|uniref:DUF2271 domain-containing protein n=1 Tax=Elizabethkingia sp. JS20170427COW TaxID=2583851 RepID=UPI001110E100|nr:DUF2271 domain-containing protein [Elizabethkingia sp. JS20170427COW]QCX52692.1 DUF2271 domain-containing protein [Elizabethkingia sp. JS20170427COW]
MKKILKTSVFTVIALLFSSVLSAQTSKYKCMVQMTNYNGEGAYIVVSLVNPNGQYEKTLYMLGPEKKWYDTLKQWHKEEGKTAKLNGITGASMAGGDRKIFNISIDNKYLNKGYKIRFESAVEDQKYVVSDAELNYTTAGVTAKTEGKGYIRYVKLVKS